MTKIQVILQKLSEVEKYFNIVSNYKKYSQKEITEDKTLQGAVSWYLYLLCQSTLDLGEIIIAYYKLRSPANYADIFGILKESEIITQDMASKMQQMAGFRNILTHMYGNVKLDIVYQVLQKDINEITNFINKIKEKLNL